MRILQTLRARLMKILDWHAVDKGLIPVVALLPICGLYQAWACYALGRPDRARLVDIDELHTLQAVLWAIMAVTAGLVMAGLYLRRRRPDLMAYQYLTVMFYSAAIVYWGYVTGSTSFAVGVVVLGCPLFGFILLERRPVLAGLALALGSLMAVSYASALGYLPYAPLVVPPVDAAGRLFWLNSIYLMATPHLLIILPLVDRALTWWREREATIHQLSRTDMLTGIHNRRSMLELLGNALARVSRHGPALAVVLLDLDYFKQVNDTWGHPTGDRVLQATARVLRQTIRQCDAVGRFGGEEFMLLLPDTTREGALALVERCRARLAEVRIIADNGETFTISGSFGVASNEGRMELGSDMLIKAADKALYVAKHNGRNRVEMADLLAA